MKSANQDRGLLLCLFAMLAVWFTTTQAELKIRTNGSGSGAAIVDSANDESFLDRGYAYLESGKYRQALKEFDIALVRARKRGDLAQEAKVQNAAGYASYLSLRGRSLDPRETRRDLEPALEKLRVALELSSKSADIGLEGWVRISLGVVYAESEGIEWSRSEFRQSAAIARTTKDPALECEAELQLVRLESSAAARLEKLKALLSKIIDAPLNERTKVNLLLNLLDQLEGIWKDGQDGISGEASRLGYLVSAKAMDLAAAGGLLRALSQSEGYRANLYALDGDSEEAIRLAREAIRHGEAAVSPDLTMRWESLLGGLLAQQGREESAIEAYRRAAFHVSEVRNNIPIYQNGKSTYRERLEPIYRGLSDLLLRAASRSRQPEPKQQLLLESIRSLESLKQSEMEDYFNDRCAVGSKNVPERTREANIHSGPSVKTAVETDHGGPIAASLDKASGTTAILYPIILQDRLEVLLVHDGVIRQQTVPVAGAQVMEQAENLAGTLRAGRDYRIASRQLYRWLAAPFEQDLRRNGIEHLVYIPDGALRLVPLSVLGEDGKEFLIRHYAVTTNTSLQNASHSGGAGNFRNALLAGVSKPSEALLNDSDLPDALLVSLAASEKRALGSGEESSQVSDAEIARIQSVRRRPEFRAAAVEALALPEVESEIKSVHQTVPSDPPLLNQDFTKDKLKKSFQSGKFQLAHISTHSYFGHSASESFIVAYDEVLKVNEIENIMTVPAGKRQSVELVTFSACDTAMGDDRAPLGFTGLAVKGKIRNAIGSLWPINDKATRRFMETYYAALAAVGGDKARALRRAQLAMLSDKDQDLKLYHPTNWAPFILVGDW